MLTLFNWFTALSHLFILILFAPLAICTLSVCKVCYKHFFSKQHLFSAQLQCCLNFSWIELQMLLSCCLIHIAIIILSHILYLVYLYPCLDLGLFMSYLCDLFIYFSFPASFLFPLILVQRLPCFLYILKIYPIIFGW